MFLSKAGALLLIIYLSVGNLNEIVIVIVLYVELVYFLRGGNSSFRGLGQYDTVHLPSSDISPGIFSSDGTRPIHFWNRGSVRIPLVFCTSSAEL
eukprot:COSAG02_NODE_48872_length_330_cov_7.978355_1_plen_94_part_01